MVTFSTISVTNLLEEILTRLAKLGPHLDCEAIVNAIDESFSFVDHLIRQRVEEILQSSPIEESDPSKPVHHSLPPCCRAGCCVVVFLVIFDHFFVAHVG